MLKIQLIWRLVVDVRVSQQSNHERRIRGRLTPVCFVLASFGGGGGRGINLFIKMFVDPRCNGTIRLYEQYCEEDKKMSLLESKFYKTGKPIMNSVLYNNYELSVQNILKGLHIISFKNSF